MLEMLSKKKEKFFAQMVEKTDKIAEDLYNHGKVNETIDFLTQFSVSTANELVDSWVLLWQQLFVKYRDGLVVTPPLDPSECDHNGAMGGVVPQVSEGGYNQDFYDDIVTNTGEHYLFPPSSGTEKSRKKELKSL